MIKEPKKSSSSFASERDELEPKDLESEEHKSLQEV